MVLAYQRGADFCRPLEQSSRYCESEQILPDSAWHSHCSRPLHAQAPLRVAAAADLEPVLPPILEQFRQATGIRAEATYQASAMLTTQIMNGAPFDLFLSADLSYPKRLIDAGLADAAGSPDSSTPITYAKGTLVLWARKDSSLPPPSLDLLRNPGSQASRHRQSRPRPLRPRRRRRAHQPQALRRPQAPPRHRRKHRPGRAVRRLRQRRRRPHLAHLRTHAAHGLQRNLLRHSARSLSAHRARRSHRQQHNPARRRSQAPRLPALARRSRPNLPKAASHPFTRTRAHPRHFREANRGCKNLAVSP